jgi:nitroreductase
MADLMEVLKGRRSHRNWEERDLGEDVVQELLEAVRWSPSWANSQCWEVVVVRTKEMKEALLEAVPKGNPARKHFTEAPVVFALCARAKEAGYYKNAETTVFGDWMLFDTGIAAQSLCLAAWARGIGTVVAGLMDHTKLKEVLGCPEGVMPVVLIPAGYPSREVNPPKRKEVQEFTHKEKWGGK